MVRRLVGVQQAYGDRLDTVVDQSADLAAGLVVVKRADHTARTVDAFVDLPAQPPRRQRFGKLQEQVMDVVALLGPHLEDIAEPPGGEKPEPAAAPLDDGVGDQRRAVHDLADARERDAETLQHLRHAVHGANRGILGRGQALVQVQPAARGFDQDEIGEGSADVETEPVVAVLHCHRISPAARAWSVAACSDLSIRETPP